MSSKRERCLALVEAIARALADVGAPVEAVEAVRNEGDNLANELGE